MYVYLALLYTYMYSVQYMVQYVHSPGTFLHIYVQCTVYGSICTFTWHFSTHLCTSSTVAVVSVQQSAAHKCILLSNPRSLVLSISLMKSWTTKYLFKFQINNWRDRSNNLDNYQFSSVGTNYECFADNYGVFSFTYVEACFFFVA